MLLNSRFVFIVVIEDKFREMSNRSEETTTITATAAAETY